MSSSKMFECEEASEIVGIKRLKCNNCFVAPDGKESNFPGALDESTVARVRKD